MGPQPLLIPASPRDVDPDAGAVVPIAVIPIDRPGHRWIGRILGLWRLGSAVDEDGIIIDLQKAPFDSAAFLPALLRWFGSLQRIATRGHQCYIIFSDMQKLAAAQDRGLPMGIEPWVAGRETVRGFLEAILLGSGQDRDDNLLVHVRPEWIEPMRELFHCCGIQPRRQDVLSRDMLVIPVEDIRRSGLLREGEMAPVPTCLWDIIKLESAGNAPRQEYDFLQGTSAEANPTIEVFDLCVPGDEYPIETFAAEGGLVTHNTFFHQTPVVQAGQAFRPGDLLVRSNYTDDKGVTALGLNLNVGFQADGENHEDSVSVSESAAKRLTSVHLYEHGLANKPDADWGDLRRWVALFPGTLSRDDLGRYDDQGIIKVGEKVKPGDRLVLASQRRTIDKMTATRSAHRLLKDVSDVWDDDVEGTVTAVHRGPRGPVVLVKSEHPARVGDKLCYSGDTEVLTSRGWVRFSDYDTQKFACVASLCPETGMVEWLHPEAFHAYPLGHEDRLHRIANARIDLVITPDHQLYARVPERSAAYGFIKAGDLGNRQVWMRTDFPKEVTHPSLDRWFGEANRGYTHFLEDQGLIRERRWWRRRDSISEVAVNDPRGGGDNRVIGPWDTDGESIRFDRVYCIELPRNHTLYVRRNGKSVWCGNSNRFGAKGVISKIYPDDEMPKDAEGKPLDILINSQSLITRINNTQIMEMALGKLARKLGGVENLPSFGKSGGIREAIARLKQANIKAFEDVAWPNGQKTRALVGPQFIMKLMFETAEKASGRGIAGGYDFLGVPTKGGDAPSKRFGRGQLEANLAFSAPLVARDAVIYKGMDIPKYWTDYQLGYRPAPPPAGMAGEAYIARLRAAGIRVQRDGPRYNFLAMSDSDPTLQGAHAIESGETVDWEDRTPRPGGLFDPAIFGPDGTRFGKIRFHKPLPHPIMEEPIRRTLGLTEAKFRSILSGTEELNGKKGPEAIAAALGAIDLDERLKGLYQQIKSTKGATRDAAIRAYQFLKSAKANDRHPKDWILSAAPILPPRYRPISASTGSDMPLIEDSNYLYKELFDANKAWADLDSQTGDTPEETLAAYDAFKAVVGIGDPIQEETRNKGIGGILKPIFGSPSPKWNWLQQKLVGTKENMVGSGVVAPDADLDMDTVGVPEAQAWPMFRVDTLRSMVRGGIPLLRANEEIDKRSETARRHLLKVMDDAVVSFTRYPVLHAYGSPAQRPVLIDGTTIRVNPFVIKGMNMDFDGDTAKVSVIHSKEAKEEALAKMLPSRMLKSMATREVHQIPGVEYGTGLYQLTTDRDPRKPVLRGLTPKQIVQMWDREEISHDQEVEQD